MPIESPAPLEIQKHRQQQVKRLLSELEDANPDLKNRDKDLWIFMTPHVTFEYTHCLPLEMLGNNIEDTLGRADDIYEEFKDEFGAESEKFIMGFLESIYNDAVIGKMEDETIFVMLWMLICFFNERSELTIEILEEQRVILLEVEALEHKPTQH